MERPINIYEFVMAHLSAKRIPQKRVAVESGVPFSTVCKIAQGSVTEPSVHTVQKLCDYFSGIDSTVNPEKQPKTESIVSVECCSGDPRHGERRKPELRGHNDRRGES